MEPEKVTSYSFIRLLFVLMVHQVTAEVTQWAVNMNLGLGEELGIENRNMNERKEFLFIPFQDFSWSLSIRSVLEAIASWIFFFRKTLETLGITFQAFQGCAISSGYFLEVFPLWVLSMIPNLQLGLV